MNPEDARTPRMVRDADRSLSGRCRAFAYRHSSLSNSRPPAGPAAASPQLADLPDDVWTRLYIEFYKDAADAVCEALVEQSQPQG